MFKFYVSLDADGYPTGTPVTEPADGLTEFVAYTTADKEYFTRNYSHYRRDENGNWLAPDNLPSLEISALLRSQQDQGQMIADRDNTIAVLQENLTTAQADATAAKQDASAANAENATLKANDQLHDSAIMELSDLLFSQMAPVTSTTSETVVSENSASDSVAATK
ncbi:MAG TPA: hypothetical protein H9875_00370 [Candidatus Levilactobacillus faecigallinarum]|uniref:Uncharacterized protein n=1 Tax=Candidatus Levilactobacillus faecigallinarum TaxID=2838638 RepID=A0A9D1QPN8_9LACO|nr:hypothetical protein [Candidatus Levilactobacillus faecigallinarum]